MPPLTRIVGASVAFGAVTPCRTTVPRSTIAGELPVTTVPSSSVTVPPVTIKSPAVGPWNVILPPVTVQFDGETLAST